MIVVDSYAKTVSRLRKLKITNMKRLIFLWMAGMLALTACQKSAPKSSGNIAGRVDSVLALMTLEEKIGQLTLFTSDIDVTGPTIRENYREDIKAGRVGAIFNAG